MTAYLLGLATLPALALVVLALWWAFWPDGTIRQWCNFDEWETSSQSRLLRKLQWRLHTLSRAHREGRSLGPRYLR